MACKCGKEKSYDAVTAYELALRIISEYGHLIASEECAEIAYRGELGDHGWLLAWEAPE